MAVQITCGECGWRSSSCRSRAQADYALRRHSCAKELARQASARRGRAKRAAVDRTPKPCGHKRANHQHGTHACYVLDKCRCRRCATASTAYERQRARNHAYGREPYVDAEPTRTHVLALRAAGMGLKTVAKVSGVPHGAVAKLIYGDRRRNLAPSKRIRWETAVRLQAVHPTFDTLAGGAFVDPTGTRRRIHALVAVGWSMSKLCERLGMQRGNFNKTLAAETVTAATARKARALYDELWDKVPPHVEWRDKISYNRSLNLAKSRGWVPPMAWDDVDTDPEPYGNAAAEPDDDVLDEVLVERLMAGRARIESQRGGVRGGSTPPELVEAVTRLHARGLNDSEIGERVGRHRDAVTKIRHRAAERAEREEERAETDRTIDVIAGWATRSEDVALDLLEDAVTA